MQQMIAIRCHYPDRFLPTAHVKDRDASSNVRPDIRGWSGPKRRRTRLAWPAPAFLVPVVLEALTRSARYSEQTRVIPGEADAYCAVHARQIGGMILTNDSDLLLYDLGDAGSVAFFTDLEFVGDASIDLDRGVHDEVASSTHRSTSARTRTCRYLSFQPYLIMHKLNLTSPKGLAYFGFELQQDPTSRFPDLLRRARSRCAQPDDDGSASDLYLFLGTYLFCRGPGSGDSPSQLLLQGSQHQKSAGGIRARLDPRISELVYRYRMVKPNNEYVYLYSSQEEGKETRMYLSFLSDDPNRSSAWHVGDDVRRLAYSIFNLSVPLEQQRSSIAEIGRRGQHIGSTEVELLQVEEIISSVNAIMARLENTATCTSARTKHGIWTIMIMRDVIRSAVRRGKLPATKEQMMELLRPSHHVKHELVLHWHMLHLQAQVQAGLYSWRIFKQLLEVVLEEEEEESSSAVTGTVFRPLLTKLLAQLTSLPLLSQGLLHPNHLRQPETIDESNGDDSQLISFIFDDIGEVTDNEEGDGDGGEEEEEKEAEQNGEGEETMDSQDGHRHGLSRSSLIEIKTKTKTKKGVRKRKSKKRKK